MANYDIEQVLINEANRIGPDIYRKTLNTSPWLKLVKKDVWPDEMGDTIRVLTYERSLPVNGLTWSGSSTTANGSLNGQWGKISIDPVAGLTTATGLTFANGVTGATPGTGFGSGNAIPSAYTVNFAQTLRSYNLTQTAIQSPALSVNDLRFSLKRKEQLSNIFAILQENTSYAWQDRYRDEYVRLAQNKIIANINTDGSLIASTGEGAAFADPATIGSTGAATGTGLATGTYVPVAGVNVPASILTQGMLDRVYMKLIRDGAGNEALDRENSRPVFGIICSSETSRNLIHDNPDIRQDYRWSSKVNELLAPLGIERSYAGFFHMVDDWGPRYNLTVSGTKTAIGATNSGSLAWTRVYPYKMVLTTQGYRWDINPDYENADYEDTIVFHPSVFANLVPKPITAAGSNVTFDAVSYMGDFKWKNIPHATENPDGTIGFFRAVLSAGSKPIRPEWGYVIRHRRASTPLGLLNVIPAATNLGGFIDETKDQANP